MAEHGAYMVPTLVCYEESALHGKAMGLSPVVMEKLRIVNEAGMEMLGICRTAGVKMGFGTDLMGELEYAQSREFAIRAARSCWCASHRVRHHDQRRDPERAGELGVIAPGAIADMLLVDGNPLKDINVLKGQGEHLSVIMKGGESLQEPLS